MEDDVITEAPSISTVGPSLSRVGIASQLRTDQPRVVSYAEPPVVTNVTGADVGLPTQPTETSSLGRILTGMGARGLDRNKYNQRQFNHGIYRSLGFEGR